MAWRRVRARIASTGARRCAPTLHGGIILLLAALFALLAFVVQRGDATPFDEAVHRALRPDDGAPGASGLFWLGPDVGAASIAVVACLALWQVWRRTTEWLAAATLLASMGGAFALVRVLKVAIGRSRVDEVAALEPVGWSNFLFPSTHTVLTVVGYGLLASYLSTRCRRWRALVWGAYAAVVAFVGVSLVYLDTHYFTDVVGGLLVGGGWLIATLRLLAALGAPSGAARRGRHAPGTRAVGRAAQGKRR